MSPEQALESNGRKYRSKKQRPCDLCRSRKIQCKLQENETACELCKKSARSCTYVLGPLRRKHRPRLESQITQFPETGQPTQGLAETNLPMAEYDESIMAMDSAPFWFALKNPEPSFSPRTAASLLTMNWRQPDFPLGMP